MSGEHVDQEGGPARPSLFRYLPHRIVVARDPESVFPSNFAAPAKDCEILVTVLLFFLFLRDYAVVHTGAR